VNGEVELCNCAPSTTLREGVVYSEKWGVGLSDDEDVLGKPVVVIDYIHQNSPLVLLKNKGQGPETFRLLDEYYIRRIAFFDQPSALDIYGSQAMIDMLNANNTFRELEVITKGGGIRGSVLTTLWLILLTLMMALPIGIASAIYLNEYVSKNSVVARYLRQFIELLTGVPSIIYGLMGLAFFAPFIANISEATGPSILSGAMTLAVIVLPVIIRTTEESLKVVPNEYRQAAFALGASKTQTVFKTVIPSALPGILSATLLSIGRIVGESAALIFAIGVIIKDEISIFGQSTSLAVHIYAMMTDEPANIELSATISLIILAIVLFLNITIKLLTRKMINKRLPGGMI
jgi:phosphate transport system permease protein